MAKPKSQIKTKILKSWILPVATIIFSLVVLLCSPILGGLLLPIYIFRYFIFKLAPLAREDLGQILSSRSAILAADDLYTGPLCTLVTTAVLEGTLDLVHTQELFVNNCIYAKCADGTPKFVELTQYISSWMGYAFWKNEKNFRIGEHLRLIELEGAVTQSQLTKYTNELVLKPFERRKSPWEVIIIPNLVGGDKDDGKPKSAAILRVHHSMSDGFGILLLTLSLATPANDSDGITKCLQSKRLKPESKSLATRFCERVYLTLRTPYDIIKYNWELADPIMPNSWHLPEKELEKKWTIAKSEGQISFNYVKGIKNSYGVGFNAVLMAAIAGSMRNFMLRNPSKKTPDFVSVGMPLPLPSHPRKLRNYWAFCTLKLPVGESCPVKRLYYVEEELQKLKKSPAPMAIFLASPLIGCLPTALIRRVVRVTNVSAVVSSMPGPLDPLFFFERRLLYIEYSFGLGAGNTGIGLAAMSSNGVIRIGATVDNALTSSCEDVQALADGVKEELLSLEKLAMDF